MQVGAAGQEVGGEGQAGQSGCVCTNADGAGNDTVTVRAQLVWKVSRRTEVTEAVHSGTDIFTV